jgi:uncharacterized phage protein (TIGR01671 family)
MASVRSRIGENMEDRYLFKAKRISDGEWVQGYLFDDGFENGRIFIGGLVIEKYNGTACDDWNVTGIDFCEVDPSTICQCTGLKDKNGKLIWENDILHNGNYFIVKWNVPCARFDIVLNNSHNIPMGEWEPMICDWKTNDFKEYKKAVDYEVIGNIFDNKELLESEG